jgi:hypothetical protein
LQERLGFNGLAPVTGYRAERHHTPAQLELVRATAGPTVERPADDRLSLIQLATDP